MTGVYRGDAHDGDTVRISYVTTYKPDGSVLPMAKFVRDVTVEVLERADDASRDLIGTCRREEQGDVFAVYQCITGRDGDGTRWVCTHASDPKRVGRLWGHAYVSRFPAFGAAPGTPAAEAEKPRRFEDDPAYLAHAGHDGYVDACPYCLTEADRPLQKPKLFRYFTRPCRMTHRHHPDLGVQCRELGGLWTSSPTPLAELEAGWTEVDVEPIGGTP